MYDLKKIKPVEQQDNSEMCQAPECPNRWTVDKGQRLCSSHAWANYRDWDAITSREWTAYRTRGDKNNYQAMLEPQKVTAKPVSQSEKIKILSDLRNLMSKNHA